jgi:hypothetical protein
MGGAPSTWRSVKETPVSFSQSFRKWLVMGSVLVGSVWLANCSAKEDDAADDAGGSTSAGRGGGVSVSGSSSVAGKGGTGSVAIAGGSAGKSSGGAGGTAGAPTAPECAKEKDCGAGQTCTAGKCVVKPCEPPATAFQIELEMAAVSVALAGSHNAWSTTASPLTFDSGSGSWKGSFKLAAGTYQYKFVIDSTTWIADPANPDTVDDGFCGFNSQITIGCEGVEPAQGVHGDGCPPDGAGGAGGEPGAGGAGGAGASGAGGDSE